MLDKFIPYYPNLNGTDAQRNLYNLEEFYSLEANQETEKLNGVGTYYKHQLVTSRMMNSKDRLFVVHKPGTGKTCTLVGYDELLKDGSAYITGAVYITTSSLTVSTQHQILCKCTNKTYFTDNILHANSNKSQASAITKSIKKWYDVTHYGDFRNRLRGKTSQELQFYYSDKVINADEISSIIKLPKGNKNDDINFHFDISRIDDEETKNSDSVYVQLWRLFHCVKRSKIIIATATPIKNYVPELFLLCNLLLPADNQINLIQYSKKVNNYFAYDFMTCKNFEPYFTGLFSYIGSPITGAYPNYIGALIDTSYKYPKPLNEWSDQSEFEIKTISSQVVIFKIEMFSIQAETHFAIISNRSKLDQFYITENEVTCCVDENGNYGSKIAYGEKYLKNPFLRGQISSKFDFIFNKESQLWNNNQGKPGCSYVYVVLTDTGGYALKDIFTENGYELFNISKVQVKTSSICQNENSYELSMDKRKRIAYLDGKTNKNVREKILTIFSSKENVHGEYIQCLIGSEVLSLGVNVGNVVRFYRVNPEWNESMEHQTQERIFRATSHDYLRESIMEQTHQDESSIVIPVDCYNLCSFSRFFYVDPSYNSFIFEPNFFVNGRCLSQNVIHFVGFYEQENPFPYENQNILNFISPNEIPANKMGLRYPTFDFWNDLYSSFGKKICVVSYCNQLYCGDLFEFVKRYNVLVTKDGNFNKNNVNGNYENMFFYFGNGSITSEIGLIPCKMMIYSGNETKYLKTEEKSIPSRKFLRYIKQYALDCLINYKRNYNLRDKDGSLECDFDRCQYTCVVDLAKNDFSNIKDPTLYYRTTQFFDNFEILYSRGIIDDCCKKIIDLVFEKGSVSSSFLYETLSVSYRDIFIFEAIYQVVISKKPYLDTLGYKCFIAFNGNTLFLQREYPTQLLLDTNKNVVGNYIQKFIGVSSDVNYFIESNKDQEIISKIESLIPFGNDNQVKADLAQLIASFTLYSSNIELIERSLKRLILKQNILPIDIYVYNHYKSQIFDVNGVYVHNISEKKVNTEYGTSNAFLKATNPFRIFENGEWRDVSSEEQRYFSNYAEKYIQNNIQTTMLYNGQFSKYYLTYINGVYRIMDSSSKANKGKSLSNAVPSETLIGINNYFQYDPYFSNHPYFDTTNYKNTLINFFRDRNLIFYFTPIILT